MPSETYISTIQRLDCDFFAELLHSCVNSICGRKPLSYNDVTKTTGLTQEEYASLIIDTKKLIIETVCCFPSADEHVSGLDEEHKQCIADCMEFQKESIKSALQLEASQISGTAMKDFDWRLKWVMGSSKLSSLRECLLNMDFHLSTGQSEIKNISLELDKNELKDLLASLEKANEALN